MEKFGALQAESSSHTHGHLNVSNLDEFSNYFVENLLQKTVIKRTQKVLYSSGPCSQSCERSTIVIYNARAVLYQISSKLL